MISQKYIVHGKVQGVWFRESTRKLAEDLGLSGHAINLSDGTVEVIARGEAVAMEKLGAWLLEGPALARVDRVEKYEFDEVVPDGFRTKEN